MKDPEENINHHKDPKFRNRNWSKGNSRDSSRDSQDRNIRVPRRSIGLEINLETISGDRSNDRARNGRNDSKQKSNRHCEFCDQDGHTWKCCWEIHTNAMKARRLKEMDDREMTEQPPLTPW